VALGVHTALVDWEWGQEQYTQPSVHRSQQKWWGKENPLPESHMREHRHGGPSPDT
jgi:hypothetical protein